MIKPTKEWLKEQAKATSEDFLDTLLWYMQEYKEYFSYAEIAEIWIETYAELARKWAKALKEDDENDY